MGQHAYATDDEDPLIEFIVLQPGLTDALLRQHENDGTGHCRVCSTGGQAGRYVWPCQTAVAARAAEQRTCRAPLRRRH